MKKDTVECRKYLKQKLRSRKLEYFESERLELMKFVTRTIKFGESNSVFVIDPPGSGKSLIKDDIIFELKNNKDFEDNYLLIEIHGLLHTEDNLILREINQKLNIDILSDEDIDVAGSCAEMLSFALQSLLTGDKATSKSIIFIFEDVDKICSSRSQILYNMLNIAQTQQASICVIGFSSRCDLTELLEKRVSSRFSGNKIYLSCNIDFEKRISDFCSCLSLDNNCKLSQNFIRTWNENIEKLVSDLAIVNLLKELFHQSKNEQLFNEFLFLSVCSLNEDHPMLELEDFQNALNMLKPEDKLILLESLSTLELCLVISLSHHIKIIGRTFTFNNIYDRYNEFVQKTCKILCVPKPDVMKAFEVLCKLNLLTPISVNSQETVKESVLYKSLMNSEDIKKAVRDRTDLLPDIKQWADSSLF